MRLRGADLVARALERAGARYVFALSGNHVMPVFDALLDTGISLIHVRHEAAAVHMADAWGRLTGEPGVALVTGGPGHANAISALFTALAAESPAVLLSGHAPLSELGKGAFQEMRQAEMAAPVAKASWTAQSAETLGEDMARAMRSAREGTPGPVHVSLPSDLLEARTDAGTPPAEAFVRVARELDRGAVLPVLAKLAAARRPLVIAGPALASSRGRERIERFENATRVPVVAMESPRGVNDPSLGRFAEALAQVDAVLLAGKRADFTLRFGAAFGEDCTILEGSADLVRWAEIAGELDWPRSGWRDEVQSAIRYRPPQWRELLQSADAPPHPVAIARPLQRLLEENESVLVSDGGEFGQWAQATLQARHRIINGPAGSIGAALPFAAAAKLARPRARVLAMLGDGTFGFHAAEIDTAVRCGIDYLAVVGNDACWNAEHQIQLRAYGQARARGCELLATRYDRVAAAFGAHGEHVAKGSQLEPALARAAAAGRVACVNVLIERTAAPVYARMQP